MFMLAASYYFYASWNPRYLVLIIFLTVVSYTAGYLLEKYEDSRVRTVALVFSTIISLGVLLIFKYYNFFADSLVTLLKLFSINISPVLTNLLLPVGISFYTFQAISYVVDIYRGKMAAELHFGYYATYVAFFPQLVAGPIERAVDLLPQIKKTHSFEYEFVTYGLKLMAWGYFKKLVIADTLAVFVREIFYNPYKYEGLTLIFAMIGFLFEIYGDFSGYSDIARGSARLFGIDLMENFKSPYFSASIQEFWRRWHISLTSWMRDYVYIPLGGSRVGEVRHILNILITFTVCGLWHGANWTFVMWGAIHGIVQSVEGLLFDKKGDMKGLIKIIRIIITFGICALAQTFFASNSIREAVYIITHVFSGISNPIQYIKNGMQTNLSWVTIRCLIVSLSLLAIYDYVSIKEDVIKKIANLKSPIRLSIYVVFGVWMLMNVSLTDNSQFYYFQF